MFAQQVRDSWSVPAAPSTVLGGEDEPGGTMGTVQLLDLSGIRCGCTRNFWTAGVYFHGSYTKTA